VDRKQVARIVDCSWSYSWHWDEYYWEEKALIDTRERLEETRKELKDLERVYEYLEKYVNDKLANNSL